MWIFRAQIDSDLSIFAISMFAWKPKTIRVDHRAFVTFGGSEKEAHKAGLKEARRLWPKSDGWQDHHARVQPIKLQFKTEPEEPEGMVTQREETGAEFLM